jgi:HAD superfamily hydrolase (TIGR01509 family)
VHSDENGTAMTERRIHDWSPAAVVFDCDGTLVDSESHWQEARLRVLRRHRLVPAPRFAERAAGLHYAACGELMAEEAGKPELARELGEQLLLEFRLLASAAPVVMPGAHALVRLLAGRLPLAVASNCPADVVETSLAGAGLLSRFGPVVVPGEGLRPKPAPDVYETAARRCGVDPADALAVEDSLTGIDAAREAGLRVVGVGPRPPAPDAGRADLWVGSLADPRLLELVESWLGDG